MFGYGEFWCVVEYENFPIGKNMYQLPARARYEAEEAFGFLGYVTTQSPRRIDRTYENCRRFKAEATIKYGEIVDASQPDLKQATGGTGGELGTTTEALEKGENTGLEVGAPCGTADPTRWRPRRPRLLSG